MKNFILIGAPASRREPFLLLHLSADISDEDREFEPFSHYVNRLKNRNGYAPQTVEVYAGCVGRFIDYVYEASQTDFAKNNLVDIEDLIFSYESFLLYGQDAEHPLSNELAHRLGKTRTTSIKSISQPIEASIRLYLEHCEARVSAGQVDPLLTRLLANSPEYRSMVEISKIKANSWLGGMVQGGFSRAIPRKGKLFAGVSRRSKKTQISPFSRDPFPIEHSVSLLRLSKPKNARCHNRNMALYAVMLATGCRSHEALQLRMGDLKLDEDGDDTVELHSPFGRATPGLTPEEASKLAWKGRQTPITFLLHPFADLFWEHLQNYLTYEYNSSVNHDFIFQKTNGRPLFTALRKDLNATFKTYASKTGLNDLSHISRHSLRHTYGTYVLNYMPMPGNSMPGLPMHIVQILMGHASILSTEKYEKHDEEVLNAYIEHGNNYIRKHGETSIQNSRLSFHERQVIKIQSIINNMHGSSLE